MLIMLLILIISSNAVTNEKEKSIVFSRISMQGLILASSISYNNILIKPLEKGVSIFGGMFNISVLTQGFNLFILLIISTILILTSFYRSNPTSDIFEEKYSLNEDTLSENSKELPVPKYNKSLSEIYNNMYNISEKLGPKNEMANGTFNNILDIVSSNKSGQFTIIEYALITVFVSCGSILLISTGDLISMFLSIELQSYGLYILSTLYRDSESATGSGLTYFLLGGMSSCFILFGSAIIYVNCGTTNFENIFVVNTINGLSAEPYVYLPYYIGVSLIMLLVGFLFKVSAAPFHFWSPDVYDGIPTIVTTFVAIVAKVSIFIFIMLFVLSMEFTNLFVYTTISNSLEEKIETQSGLQNIEWKNIIIISSLMSLLIGSILGLTQHRIKRLFAYSTISHVGFILLALCVSTVESIQGYIFYLLQYTISNINAFFLLISIGFTMSKYIKSTYKSSELSNNEEHIKQTDTINSPVQLISQLKGYFYINSYITISLTITLFSFIGIPPLLGFFAKQVVLSSALDNGFVFITLVAIITSVIAAVYYLDIVKNLFFSSPPHETSKLDLFVNDSKKLFVIEKSSIYNNTATEPVTLDKDPSSFSHKASVNEKFLTYVTINSALSIVISILTIIILTFMYIPNEWLRTASILSIGLFRI